MKENKECIGEYCDGLQQKNPQNPYVSYNIAVTLGNPVEQIVKKVKEDGHDLVVMSNLGHNPLHDAIMGSTVKRVLRRVEVPVLIIKINQDS